jgi:signal transduction histidine kinase
LRKMYDTDHLFVTFFQNISIMVSVMYLASLVYKFSVYRLSPAWKEALFILLAIGSGWITMRYGLVISDSARFDLRFMAIIVAPMFVRRQRSILIIGLGIGVGRLTFGLDLAAAVGFVNIIAMSLLCIAVVRWAERRKKGFYAKMTAIIVSIHLAHVVVIALSGVLPPRFYLLHVAPGSIVLGLALSFGFVLIVRELTVEAERKFQLKVYNDRLIEQNVIAEQRAAELQAAKKELEQKNEQLLLASRYKTDFLANMSHELRTPLNSMLALSQMLEDNPEGRLSSEEVRYASIIHSSGKDLLGMINEVLDLSKIEAGRMDLHITAFSVSDMLEHLNCSFGPLAAQRGLQFTVSEGAGVPGTIFADGQRLQQILQNMLSNALKFTERGRIGLSVYPVECARGGSAGTARSERWLAFSVDDTGIGIPEDKREAIFEAFFQADGTISRQYGGTGLGLAISRRFAALMGGWIGLESEEGAGSRFTLYLPWEVVTGGEIEAFGHAYG